MEDGVNLEVGLVAQPNVVEEPSKEAGPATYLLQLKEVQSARGTIKKPKRVTLIHVQVKNSIQNMNWDLLDLLTCCAKMCVSKLDSLEILELRPI